MAKQGMHGGVNAWSVAMPARYPSAPDRLFVNLAPLDDWIRRIKALTSLEARHVLHLISYACPEDGVRVAVGVGETAKKALLEIFVSKRFATTHRDFVESFFPENFPRPATDVRVVLDSETISNACRSICNDVAHHYQALLKHRQIAFSVPHEVKRSLSPGEEAALVVIERRLRIVDEPRGGLGASVGQILDTVGRKEASRRLRHELSTLVEARLGSAVSFHRGSDGRTGVRLSSLETRKVYRDNALLTEIANGTLKFRDFSSSSARNVCLDLEDVSGRQILATFTGAVDRMEIPPNFNWTVVPRRHPTIGLTVVLYNPQRLWSIVNPALPTLPSSFVPSVAAGDGGDQVGTTGDYVIFAEQHGSVANWSIEHVVSPFGHVKKTLRAPARVYDVGGCTLTSIETGSQTTLRVHHEGTVKEFRVNGTLDGEPEDLQNGYIGLLDLPGNRIQVYWGINGGDLATSGDYRYRPDLWARSASNDRIALLFESEDRVLLVEPPRHYDTRLPGVRTVWCDVDTFFAVNTNNGSSALHSWNGKEWIHERDLINFQMLPNQNGDWSILGFLERTARGFVASARFGGRFITSPPFDDIECSSLTPTGLQLVVVTEEKRQLCRISPSGEICFTAIDESLGMATQVFSFGTRSFVILEQPPSRNKTAILCDGGLARVVSTNCMIITLSEHEKVAVVKEFSNSPDQLYEINGDVVHIFSTVAAECRKDGALALRQYGDKVEVIQIIDAPHVEFIGHEQDVLDLLHIVEGAGDRNDLEKFDRRLRMSAEQSASVEASRALYHIYPEVLIEDPQAVVELVPTSSVPLDAMRIESLRQNMGLVPYSHPDENQRNLAELRAPIYRENGALSGSDPQKAKTGNTLVKFDTKISGFFVTALRGAYDAGAHKWRESSVAPSSTPPSGKAPLRGLIDTRPLGSGSIVLPRLFGGQIDPASIVRLGVGWWPSREPLTHQTAASGVNYVTDSDRVNTGRIEYKTYSGQDGESPCELTSVEFIEFQETFSVATGDEFSAPLAELESDLTLVVKAIREVAPHLRGRAIEAVVQEYGYYDIDSKEVDVRFDSMPISELLRSMRDRASYLRAHRIDLEPQLRGKLFAGTCGRFAILSATIARECGLFASVAEGLVTHESKTISLDHPHAIAYYWWPNAARTGVREIAIDGTPLETSSRRSRQNGSPPSHLVINTSADNSDVTGTQPVSKLSAEEITKRPAKGRKSELHGMNLAPFRELNLSHADKVSWRDVVLVEQLLGFFRYHPDPNSAEALQTLNSRLKEPGSQLFYASDSPLGSLLMLLDGFTNAWAKTNSSSGAQTILFSQIDRGVEERIITPSVADLCREILRAGKYR